MVACPEEFKNVIYQNRIAAASYIASSILPATRFPSLCQLLDSRTNVPQIFFISSDQSKAFCLMEPPTAQERNKSLVTFVLFDEFDLPANSLVGIGTDGESTMTGLGNALQSADLNFVSVDSLLQHTRESIHSHIDPYLLISDAIDSLSSQKYLPPLHKEDSWINVSDMWIRANTLSQPRKSFRKAKHFTPPLRHHRPRTTDATLSRRPINPLLSQLLYKPRPKPNYSFEFFLCYHGRHVMLKGRSATYGDKG
ncbi:hypothetical protein BLNAU_2957 [Blattamonas nauphoetae]|uniref:Uncharacterized protein n=1 Tax=Blattamonas nauphoetae TaxID=2049346 RepID=A0ABQ9YDR0_9EUKA|nr:hypothetical protein BLNAU_2957 [Blattamonas nauphoetae]